MIKHQLSKSKWTIKNQKCWIWLSKSIFFAIVTIVLLLSGFIIRNITLINLSAFSVVLSAIHFAFMSAEAMDFYVKDQKEYKPDNKWRYILDYLYFTSY